MRGKGIEFNNSHYVIELNAREQYPDDASRFATESGATYVIRSMRYAGENEVKYIRDFWQEYEDAIESQDGINQTGKHYSEYIDIDSLCRQFLQFELYGETSLKASIYFYKDTDLNGDGKIYAVYPWDVEHSMCKSGYGILGENAEQNMPYWEYVKNRPELIEKMGQIWSDSIKEEIIDFFGDLAENDTSEAALLYRKYEYDLLLNNDRWSNDDSKEKYDEIMSFMKNRVDYMDEVFSVE